MIQSTITVLEHAESQDLLSLETVKDELGITDNTKDTRLRRLIASASADASNWCRRPLREERVQEDFRLFTRPRAWAWGWPDSYNNRHHPDHPHEDYSRLVLQRKPVAMIDRITVDDTELAAGDDYVLDQRNGILTRVSSGRLIDWTGGLVSVLYVGGFRLGESLQSEGVSSEGESGAVSGGAMAQSSFPVDPAIEKACLILVSQAYATSARDPALRSIEIPGVVTRMYDTVVQEGTSALPDTVTQRLQPWKRLF